MYPNVNLEAAWGVLMFTGACFSILLAGLTVVHALFFNRRERASEVLLTVLAGAVLYAGLLVAVDKKTRVRLDIPRAQLEKRVGF